MIEITRNALDPQPITASVRRDSNGAVVTFLGTTRRTSEGKTVLYLEYEAYEPMARRSQSRFSILSSYPCGNLD